MARHIPEQGSAFVFQVWKLIPTACKGYGGRPQWLTASVHGVREPDTVSQTGNKIDGGPRKAARPRDGGNVGEKDNSLAGNEDARRAPSAADPSARRVVVFDFDGTIADSMPSIVATATRVLTDWGLPPERMADVPKLVGPPFPQAFSMVFGMSDADAREVTGRYREAYERLGASAWPAFPGMAELLDGLRAAGRTLAVASSKRTRLLRRGLTDQGLIGRFDVALGKESDAPQTKARTLAEVLRRLGASPDEAVMVGDRFYDVNAATACGMPCVGVTYGRTAPRSELEQAGACAVARSVGELGRVLLGR